jgi:hypothetical protein
MANEILYARKLDLWDRLKEVKAFSSFFVCVGFVRHEAQNRDYRPYIGPILEIGLMLPGQNTGYRMLTWPIFLNSNVFRENESACE